METIKSYTSLQQSKVLAEILPLESADMYYTLEDFVDEDTGDIFSIEKVSLGSPSNTEIAAWSLAALLGVLPFHLIVNNQRYAFSMHKGLNKDGETYMLRYNVFNTDVCLYSTDYYNNPIDACYELILKLNELKML